MIRRAKAWGDKATSTGNENLTALGIMKDIIIYLYDSIFVDGVRSSRYEISLTFLDLDNYRHIAMRCRRSCTNQPADLLRGDEARYDLAAYF